MGVIEVPRLTQLRKGLKKGADDQHGRHTRGPTLSGVIEHQPFSAEVVCAAGPHGVQRVLSRPGKNVLRLRSCAMNVELLLELIIGELQ